VDEREEDDRAGDELERALEELADHPVQVRREADRAREEAGLPRALGDLGPPLRVHEPERDADRERDEDSPVEREALAGRGGRGFHGQRGQRGSRSEVEGPVACGGGGADPSRSVRCGLDLGMKPMA